MTTATQVRSHSDITSIAATQQFLSADSIDTAKPVKPSKPFAKYSSLLSAEYITEGEIRSLRTNLNNSSYNSTLRSDERDTLRDAWRYSDDIHIRLHPSHSAKGIEFLRRCAFRKDGSPRQDERSKVFSSLHLDVIRSFTCFEFVGFCAANNLSSIAYYHYDRRDYLAVYRCYGESGYFDYAYSRDLGGFEILDEMPAYRIDVDRYSAA